MCHVSRPVEDSVWWQPVVAKASLPDVAYLFILLPFMVVSLLFVLAWGEMTTSSPIRWLNELFNHEDRCKNIPDIFLEVWPTLSDASL